MIASQEKHTPKAGDYLQPDEWKNGGNNITLADDFKDSSFPGCQFRIVPPNHLDYDLAINIKVTGKPHYTHLNNWYESRCKIEFVGDGEPSTFSGGVLYHD